MDWVSPSTAGTAHPHSSVVLFLFNHGEAYHGLGLGKYSGYSTPAQQTPTYEDRPEIQEHRGVS